MKITIAGSGEMGRGIGLYFSSRGNLVTLYDNNTQALENAHQYITLKNIEKKNQEKQNEVFEIQYSNNLIEAVQETDLIIEAIPEVLDWKVQFFRDLERLVSNETVIATNTSTISIETLSRSFHNPERFIGMHFFNPAEKMKLVELIPGNASKLIVERMKEFLIDSGKKVILVEKNRPGFIVNRIIAPTQILTNAILEEKKILPDDFDAIFESIPGMPPFELLDFVGLDIAVNTMEYYAENLHPDFKPGKFLLEKIEAGQLGKKVGKGIYDWKDGIALKRKTNQKTEFSILHMKALMINEAFRVYEEKVTSSKNEIDDGIKYGLNQRPIFRALKKDLIQEAIYALEYLQERFQISYFTPCRSLLNSKKNQNP